MVLLNVLVVMLSGRDTFLVVRAEAGRCTAGGLEKLLRFVKIVESGISKED